MGSHDARIRNPSPQPPAFDRLRGGGTHEAPLEPHSDRPKGGEFLDLVVIADTGRLTPRSSTYLKLAYTYETIFQELNETQAKYMSTEQAREIAHLILTPEAWHFAIEGDASKIAGYEDLWLEAQEHEPIPTFTKFKNPGERKFVKGPPRPKLPESFSLGALDSELQKVAKIRIQKTREAIESKPMTWQRLAQFHYSYANLRHVNPNEDDMESDYVTYLNEFRSFDQTTRST